MTVTTDDPRVFHAPTLEELGAYWASGEQFELTPTQGVGALKVVARRLDSTRGPRRVEVEVVDGHKTWRFLDLTFDAAASTLTLPG